MENIHTKSIKTTLVELGLGTIQADIYLAVLNIGGGTIMDIARAGAIERTGIYYHIDELIRKGLLKTVRNGKRTVYLPSNPSLFRKILEQKTRSAEETIPKLEKLFQTTHAKSTSNYFWGEEGIINLYEQLYDIASSISERDEYLIFGHSFDAVEALPEFFPKYVTRRKKNKINTKIILPSSERPNKSILKKKNDPKVIAKYSLHIDDRKYLPKEYEYPGTTLILGNYVAMIDFANYFATLTENQNLAQTWRVFFKFMWDKL